MIEHGRWMYRLSMVLLIVGLIAPMIGTTASAAEGRLDPAAATPVAPDEGNAGNEGTPEFAALTPEDSVEIPAVCADGALSAPDLALATTPGITYFVDVDAPYTAGQIVTITATLDDPSNSTWAETLPEGWNPVADGMSLTRTFTFTNVPCEPATPSPSVGTTAVDDISIALSVPASVAAGETLSFALTISNKGTEAATDVSLMIVLATITGLDWSVPNSCVLDGDIVNCSNLAVPARDGEVPGTLQLDFSSLVPLEARCGFVDTTALLTERYNGFESIPTTVECLDAEVTGTTGQNTVIPGQFITFTYTVESESTTLESWAFRSKAMPGDDWTINSTTNAFAVCTLSDDDTGAQVACDGSADSPFPARDTATVTVSRLATAADCGTTITADSPTFYMMFPNAFVTGNATSVEVNCDATLSIVESGTDIVAAGDTLDYTMTLSNTGLTDAAGVTLLNALPADGGWELPDDAPVSCGIDGQTLTCTDLIVPANDSIALTVSGTMPAGTSCTIINNASEITFNESTTTSNTVTSYVGCSEDGSFAISRLALSPTVEPGELAYFTYVVVGENPGISKFGETLVPAPKLRAWSLAGVGSGSLYFSRCGVLYLDEGVDFWCENLATGTLAGSFSVSGWTSEEDCGEVYGSSDVTTAEYVGRLDTITVECNDLSIDIDAPETASPGESIDFGIKLSNTGDAAFTGVTVVSDLPDTGTAAVTAEGCTVGAVNAITCTNLAIPAASGDTPGTLTIPFTYTVPSDGSVCDDLVSTASFAFGENDPSGNASDTTSITCDPKLELTATGAMVVDAPGTVDINYTISNPGNVEITDVHLSDGVSALTPVGCNPIPPDDSSSTDLLIPGGAILCQFTYTVTQAEIDDGRILDFQAKATGTVIEESISSDSVGPTISIEQNPDISLTVEPSITIVDAPGTIDFTFTFENTGNVTLTNVALDDGLPKTVQLFFALQANSLTLAPGDSNEVQGTLQITQDDIDAGNPVVTTATLTGIAPDGSKPADSVETQIYVPEAGPALAIEKTASTPEGETSTAGTVITYTFKVTNIGNVTMSNIVVNDQLEGLVWDASGGKIASLAPTDSATVQAVYTVTAADAASRKVVNAATAIGDAPSCETDETGCGITSSVSSATVAVDPSASTATPTPSAIPSQTPEVTGTPSPDVTPDKPGTTPTPATVTGLPSTGYPQGSPLANAGWMIVLLLVAIAVGALGLQKRVLD